MVKCDKYINISIRRTKITKKLEEILNLPESKKVISNAETREYRKKKAEDAAANNSPAEPLLRDISEFDKISAALPKVKGLGDASDAEFDALAQRATDAYDDLMDLGMNVEARYSGRVFEVAASMLKNAIDAKAAKIDKKLKIIELQLKKQKIDNELNNDDSNLSVQGTGVIVSDRNSLIEKLKNLK